MDVFTVTDVFVSNILIYSVSSHRSCAAWWGQKWVSDLKRLWGFTGRKHFLEWKHFSMSLMNSNIFLEVWPNSRNSRSCMNRLREKWKERGTKENRKFLEILLNMGQMYFKNLNGLCPRICINDYNVSSWVSTMHSSKCVTCWDKSIIYNSPFAFKNSFRQNNFIFLS